MAVLSLPVVLLKSAPTPMAVLLLPVVLLKSAKTDGRVEVAGCEAKERIITLSGVVVGIASVRWRGNRLRFGESAKQPSVRAMRTGRVVVFGLNQRIHGSSFLFPRYVDSVNCGSGRGEEPSGANVLRLIQIRLATPSLGKLRQLVKTIRRKRESPMPIPGEPLRRTCQGNEMKNREVIRIVDAFNLRWRCSIVLNCSERTKMNGSAMKRLFWGVSLHRLWEPRCFSGMHFLITNS